MDLTLILGPFRLAAQRSYKNCCLLSLCAVTCAASAVLRVAKIVKPKSLKINLLYPNIAITAKAALVITFNSNLCYSFLKNFLAC